MKNRITILKENYIINKEKRTIVCILRCEVSPERLHNYEYIYPLLRGVNSKFPFMKGYQFTVVGKSKCHDSDEFDETLGKRIAESRAKIKMFKTGHMLWKRYWHALSLLVSGCIKKAVACRDEHRVECNHLKTLLKNEINNRH